jgi:hypothetical protein
LEDGTARSEAAAVAFAGRDLAVGGAPIATAPQEAVLIAGSIALERHHAIAWLVGDTPLWSEVDTST